jgi:hypothetical protein
MNNDQNIKQKEALMCQVCKTKKAKKGCNVCRQFLCNTCFGETDHNVHKEELYYPKCKIEIDDLISSYKDDIYKRFEVLKQVEEETLKEQAQAKINPNEIQMMVDQKQSVIMDVMREVEKLNDFFKKILADTNSYFNNLNNRAENGVYKFKANDFKLCKFILLIFRW